MVTMAYIATDNICGDTDIPIMFKSQALDNTDGYKVYASSCAQLGYNIPDGSGSMAVPDPSFSSYHINYKQYKQGLLMI